MIRYGTVSYCSYKLTRIWSSSGGGGVGGWKGYEIYHDIIMRFFFWKRTTANGVIVRIWTNLNLNENGYVYRLFPLFLTITSLENWSSLIIDDLVQDLKSFLYFYYFLFLPLQI